VTASGFSSATIEYRSPVAAHDRLQPVAVDRSRHPEFEDLVDTFNANVEKLNMRMFTYLDYAIVARRV
jgi:hypothetical protein